MPMRVSWKLIFIAVVIAGLALTSACGKKNAAEQAMSIAKSASETMVPTSVQNDYSKPYLTEEKMQKFLESLKEEFNPLGILAKGGQSSSYSDLKDKIEEYNAFAKKYGFADYADYMAVWGRITVGGMEIAAEEMNKSGIQMMQDSIKSAEENLKKPDLSPEMKSIYEEQIKSSQKSLEEMQKPDTSSKQLNAQDMALVLKYKAQIDEATKKLQDAKAQQK